MCRMTSPSSDHACAALVIGDITVRHQFLPLPACRLILLTNTCFAHRLESLDPACAYPCACPARYTGWGLNATSLWLEPETPLGPCTLLPDGGGLVDAVACAVLHEEQEGAGGGGVRREVKLGVGVGVGVGGGLVVLGVVALVAVSKRRKEERGAGSGASFPKR